MTRLGTGVLSLVIANAFFLLMYFRFDLTLFQLVVVYWVECFWVGIFSALKLLTASVLGDPFENRYADVSKGGNLFLSGLTIWFAGGAFLSLFGMTGLLLFGTLEGGLDPAGAGHLGDHIGIVLGGSLLLAIPHGVGFVVHFLISGAFRTVRAGTLVAAPFKRCFGFLLMLIVTVGAVFLFPGLISATAFAVILILLKVAADCRFQLPEPIPEADE